MNTPLAEALAAAMAEGIDDEPREASTICELIASRLTLYAYSSSVSPDVNLAAMRLLVDAMAGYDPALSTRED